MSLADVSAAAGLAINTVRNVENSGSASMDNVLKVAAVVGIELRPVRVRAPKPANKLKATQ